MKRGFKYLFIFLLVFCFGMIKVSASSVTMKVSSNKSSVVVGNNVTVTVTISSSEALGSWVYTLNYDKNKFSFVPGSYALSETDAGDGSKKSVSYKYTFKAKASGTASFSLSNYQASLYSKVEFVNVNVSSSSVKVMTQAELQATYSKNNYLKSLVVEGYPLDFNKDTLEYNLELENEVTSLNISASLEDSKSSLSGTGVINVSEGLNKIEIVVTAQNGNKRVYIINATVKELAPVVVEIDGKEYSVIRKKGILEAPVNYEETTVNILNEEILAYKNEITNILLVGLKDSDGNNAYYIYNLENGSFTLYKELNFNKFSLILKEFNKELIPGNYKKSTIAINEEEITVYKLNESSDYSLIYGMNIDTGEVNLYVYDEVEHTILRYNNEEASIYKKLSENYLLYLIIVSSLFGVFAITILIIFLVKKRKVKKI